MGILKKIKTKLFLDELPAENNFGITSYSQEGEDILLKRMVSNLKKGVYIDIGAHHPIRFSNSYLFYKSGWRGINIDPIPGTKEIFDKIRSEDINLECAISNQKQLLTYFNFKEKALNTFSETIAQQYLKANWELENTLEIMTCTLKEILDTHLPVSSNIDFMTIDVEGLEMDVLSSNDWTKYKPTILLIEILDCPLEKISTNEITLFLKNYGYSAIAKTFNTVFFQLKID